MISIDQREGNGAPGLARWGRWRTPPNWAPLDWRQEAGAEAAAAAVCAYRDFDSSRGIPLRAFLQRRATEAVLTRYRREWRYALRTVCAEEHDSLIHPPPPDDPPIYESVRRALLDLPAGDRRLLYALYCQSLPEEAVAAQCGITQQAVSKRKHRILRALRSRLTL